MSETGAATKAADVRIGDHLRTRLGAELTVTRIDRGFMDREGMIASVEDSDEQWLRMLVRLDAEVELVRRRGGVRWR